jgi:hypothetical protein
MRQDESQHTPQVGCQEGKKTMLTYSDLVRHPARFQRLTGVSVSEFEALLDKFLPAWEEAEYARLMRPDRQREIGGGRHQTLALANQLLMVMLWLRLYLSQGALGALFAIDKSTVSRRLRPLLSVLRQVSEIDWPEPPARGQGKELGEALHDHPDLLHIVDVTEQPVQRPNAKVQEKAYYSGKQRCHTCKHAIGVNEQGIIRTLSPVSPGSVHDLTHLRQSGLLETIPHAVTVVADAGFEGLYTNLPNHSVVTPHKAKRNHPLLPDQKRINHELSAIRVVVENVIAHLKHFAILSHRFRHTVETWHDDVFWVVAALVNRRTLARLAT